jgi:hypothetical protein
MNLELTPEEKELLLEVLPGRMSELRQEVRHSRVSSFTEQLKQKEAVLRSIIEKLGSDD